MTRQVIDLGAADDTSGGRGAVHRFADNLPIAIDDALENATTDAAITNMEILTSGQVRLTLADSSNAARRFSETMEKQGLFRFESSGHSMEFYGAPTLFSLAGGSYIWSELESAEWERAIQAFGSALEQGSNVRLILDDEPPVPQSDGWVTPAEAIAYINSKITVQGYIASTSAKPISEFESGTYSVVRSVVAASQRFNTFQWRDGAPGRAMGNRFQSAVELAVHPDIERAFYYTVSAWGIDEIARDSNYQLDSALLRQSRLPAFDGGSGKLYEVPEPPENVSYAVQVSNEQRRLVIVHPWIADLPFEAQVLIERHLVLPVLDSKDGLVSQDLPASKVIRERIGNDLYERKSGGVWEKVVDGEESGREAADIVRERIGDDIWERDPDTGKWTKVVDGDSPASLLPDAQAGRAGGFAYVDGDSGATPSTGAGLTAAERALLLPPLPDRGSRNDKIAKFDGDVLGWETDAGGVGGATDQVARDAAAAAQSTADSAENAAATAGAQAQAAQKAANDASTLAGAALPVAGGTMTGALTLSGAPTANLQAATKKYVDDNAGSSAATDGTARSAAAAAQATADAALPKAGGTMTGKIVLDGAPTANLHAASKKYVDDNAGAESFSELTGNLAASQVQDGSLPGTKLTGNSVTASQVGPGAIGTSRTLDGRGGSHPPRVADIGQSRRQGREVRRRHSRMGNRRRRVGHRRRRGHCRTLRRYRRDAYHVGRHDRVRRNHRRSGSRP